MNINSLNTSISIKTNSNLIFVRTLFALLSDEKLELTQFGEIILKEFQYIKELPSFKNFRENLKDIKLHEYIYYVVHLNKNFIPKSLAYNDGFGPNRLKYFNDRLGKYTKNVFDESKFFERYQNFIEPEYIKIANNMQRSIKRIPISQTIFEYWKVSNPPRLVIIPDPLGVHEGFSSSRKGVYYSITGASKYDGKIEINPEYMVLNSVHEFSHLFFKDNIYSENNYEAKNTGICSKLSSKLENIVQGEALSDYNDVRVSLEETFIRAVQIYLYFKINIYEKSSASLLIDRNFHLENIYKKGFLYVKKFYNSIEIAQDPMIAYFSVIERI
jgi:hypothetical protein